MPTILGFGPDAFTISGNTLRLDPTWDATADQFTFDITDGDDTTFAGDGDGANEVGDDTTQSAIITDADGTQTASGQAYLEDSLTFTDPQGGTVNVFRVEIGGTLVGYVADGFVQPGVTYTFTTGNVTLANAPDYSEFQNATYDNGPGNTIEGGSLADTFYGERGTDIMYGGGGNDSISSGFDGDTVYGGAGDDIVDSFDHGNGSNSGVDDLVYGGTGNDSIAGSNGADSLYGGTQNDTIEALNGADTVYAGDGNDTVDGGTGNDQIYAGNGDDTILLSSNSGTDLIYGGSGTDTLDARGVLSNLGSTSFNSIEVIYGSNLGDTWNWGSLAGQSFYGGTSGDTVNAGNLDDVLAGGGGGDTLYGAGGSDEIDGDAGNDSLFGGDDNDTIDGGDGSDLIYGGDGVDIVQNSDGADTIYGGAGDDRLQTSGPGTFTQTIFGGSGNDDINTFGGDDIVYGGAGNEIVRGDSGAEFISGGSGSDTLFAGFNNDTVFGGAGADFLYGSFGNDTILGDDGADTLYGEGGNDTLNDGAGSDTIYGGSGDDILVESNADGGGNDLLYGGTGDDRIDISNGGDTAFGGDGSDTFNSLGSSFGKTVTGGEGGTDSDLLSWSGETDAADALNISFSGNEAGSALIRGQTVTFSEIEAIEGTQAGDTFNATNDTVGVSIDGQAGDDQFFGGDGNDQFTGGLGNDSIVGDSGNDLIYGGAGADSVDAGSDSDTVFGGANADTLDGGGGADEVYGGDGADFTNGGTGSDTVYAGAGNDNVFGFTGNDTVFAGAGQDFIEAEGGTDTIYAGDDQDTVQIANGAGTDTVYGGEGGTDADTLDLSALSTRVDVDLTANEAGTASDGTNTANFFEFEQFVLTSGNDSVDARGTTAGVTVDAGAGNDNFRSESGNDVFFGGDGRDGFGVFGGAGGFGTDSMDGGAGSDDLSFSDTGGLTLSFTNGAGGIVTDGTDTVTFTSVEGFDADDGDSFWDFSLASFGVQLTDFSGNDSVIGSAFNDSIFDFSGSSSTGTITVDAGAGDDFVEGSFNSDSISAGTGDDVVNALRGADLVYGGAGNDEITSDGGDSTVYGGAGNDTLNISFGVADDTLFAGSGNDTLIAGAGNDTVYGGSGEDTLFGSAGNDTLTGGTGNDLVYGGDDQDTIQVEDGFGTDTIYGGEGGADSDTLDLSALGPGVTVTFTGDEQGTFTDGTDTGTFFGIEDIILTEQDDDFDASNDTVGVSVDGRGGNDTLTGGTGDDVLSGGSGENTITAGDGADTVTSSLGDDLVYAGDGEDRIVDVVSGGTSTFYAGAGNDYIEAALANAFTAFGGDGNDTIETTNFSQTIDAGSGNDTILGDDDFGTSDFDSLGGGAGDDIIYSGFTGSSNQSGDLLDGGAGSDTLYGGTAFDTFYGGTGNDTMFGDQGGDGFFLEDTFGTDLIYGGEGGSNDIDFLYAGNVTTGVTVTFGTSEDGTLTNGTDTATFHQIEAVFLTDSADLVDASASTVFVELYTEGGNDTVLGSNSSDFVSLGAGNDTVSAGAGDDVVNADAGNDTLSAGAGDDVVNAGTGNDTLTGGSGNDTLTGGAGQDTFVLDAAGGDDTITDFDTADSGDTVSQGATNYALATDRLDTTALDDGSGGSVTADEVTVSGGGGSDQVLTFPNGETLTVPDGTVNTSTQATQFASLVAMGVPPCFAPGTMILTDRGEVTVERLRIGDMLITADHGPQPLRWIGRRVEIFQSRDDKHKPIEFKAGSLGCDLPKRDLVVSPQHRMVLAGEHVVELYDTPEALALAKALTSRDGIRRMKGMARITYFSLLLARHEIIFAEGAPTESFRPGPVALEGFQPEIREQIYAIYPRLRAEPIDGLGPPARPILTRKQAEAAVAAQPKAPPTSLAKARERLVNLRNWDDDLEAEKKAWARALAG